MSNQPQPILVNTDSDTSIDDQKDAKGSMKQTSTRGRRDQEMTPALNSKIFRATDIIPDFSEVNTVSAVDARSPSDEVAYHCISTKGTKPSQPAYRPETIDTIIRNLDKHESDASGSVTDDSSEFVTKSRFSTLIGDMRVDLLSLISLVNVLSKNSTANDSEMQNIKRDICRLVDENTQLKERLARLREEGDRRYDTMCKLYDSKIEELQRRVGSSERSTDVPVLVEGSRGSSNIRVVRKPRTQQRDDLESTDDTNDSVDSVPKFVDSQAEKRATKFKVSQPRTRTGANDVFGTVVEKPEEPIMSGAFRQTARKDVVETKVKQVTDSKTARANRLGLGQGTISDKTSIRRM
ncbi:hypothetical protein YASMINEVIRUS_331 [Yasminevirus sp. GU-2018]|uniref:Uncharacterized protein n=1 Tax=Yasminevirus sp. GU-2018 TaxID=2420051 RepID=A0A5K0U7F8_9VIRU|nr:hypothetical protein YASMINEVIRUS_331 [Yasminevirus sp. GU-2018]